MTDVFPEPPGFQLHTFGSLRLTGRDSAGLSALVSQPKRAALLAYLAVARPRGFHRRDTLLALLWPDSDAVRARHALSQVVYLLRRTLTWEIMLSQGDEALGLDGGRLWCDAVAFEEALAAERRADALELYRGEFLAGFFVPDASPELDEWIASERGRFRSMATAAARALAAQEEAAGDAAGAAHWARRAVTLAPDDEQGVRALLGLLRRLGDRTGALRAYDDFARRLKEQFDIEPSAELRELAAEIQRAPAALGSTVAVAPSAPAVLSPARTPPELAGPARPGRSWTVPAIVLVAALVAVLLPRLVRVGRPALSSPILAVAAINDFTHPEATAAPVLADLLSTSLARLPSVQVIATSRLYEVQSQLEASTHAAATLYDAARQAGASQLIEGSLHPGPNGVRLDLQLIDIANGAIRKGYRAEGADLFAAVDQVTTVIARDLGAPVPAEPVGEVTTRSLVAYRLYQEGLRAYYQMDVTAAARLFRAALEEDTAFAMAAYWAAQVSAIQHHQADLPLLERAARLADRATDRERLFIRETLTEQRMEPAALAVAETLAFRYPADPDGQFALGRVRVDAGEFLGAVEPLERVLAMDSLSLSGHPAHCRACDAYLELVGAYVWADSLPAAERIAHRFVSRQPTSGQAWLGLAYVLELAGQDSAALEAYRVADSLAPASLPQDAFRAQLAIRRGDYAEADIRLRRLASEHSWAEAEWFLAISLRNQGRMRETMALPVARQEPMRSLLLLETGHPREAAARFAAMAATAMFTRLPGHAARNRAFTLTHVATCLTALGDTAKLAALADTVEAVGAGSLFGRDRLLHHYIRGLLFAARRQRAPAAEEYRQAIFSWNLGYTRANYALGKALLELNRPTEAVRVLQPALRGSLEASNLYITRTELHEMLAQAFALADQSDSAAAHYLSVERAWRGADPPLRERYLAAKQYLAGH